MQQFDVYVIVEDRSLENIENFISKWVGIKYVESAESYDFPYLCDHPNCIDLNLSDLIIILIKNREAQCHLYWNRIQSEKLNPIQSVMLFFNVDETITFGLGVEVDSVNYYEESKKYLELLASTMDAKYGFVSAEQPPPDTMIQFIATAQLSDMPKLLT